MIEYEALLRLQDIDLQLMRYSRQLKAMPQQKKIAALDAAKRKLAGQLTKIVGQRKDAEIDVADSEAEHAHLLEVREEVRAKLNASETGYREISSFEAQLTSLAKKLEKVEFKHTDKMAALEKAQKAEKNARDLEAKLDEERVQLEASFKQDSADIMAELITGGTVEEAKRLSALFIRMIQGEELTEDEQDDLDEAYELESISHMPARVKCAELAWRTLDGMI